MPALSRGGVGRLTGNVRRQLKAYMDDELHAWHFFCWGDKSFGDGPEIPPEAAEAAVDYLEGRVDYWGEHHEPDLAELCQSQLDDWKEAYDRRKD